MKTTKEEKARALELLKDQIKPGATIYTVLRGVSSSGMTRYIDVYMFEYNEEDKRIYKSWLSGLIARAGIFPWNDKRECLTVGGGGMDMGHHVVYNLSTALGYARYDREDKKDTNCYGLNQEWL